MEAMAWRCLARRLFVLGMSALALTYSGCERLACDEPRAESLSKVFEVKVRCSGSVCRAALSAVDAKRLSDGLPSGADIACGDVSSRPDVKSSSGSINDPCCNSGGSACIHFYQYVVSESARALCIAL